jgi:hypothetical protein
MQSAAVPTLGLIQLDGAGGGVVNLVVGGLLYLGVYLTLAPILGSVEKQDIMNLRTLRRDSWIRRYEKKAGPLR